MEMEAKISETEVGVDRLRIGMGKVKRLNMNIFFAKLSDIAWKYMENQDNTSTEYLHTSTR